MVFLWFSYGFPWFPMANPRNRPPSAWPGTVLRRCWNRRRCWRCRRPALGQAFGTGAGEAWAVFGGEVCDVGWSYGSLNARTHTHTQIYIYIYNSNNNNHHHHHSKGIIIIIIMIIIVIIYIYICAKLRVGTYFKLIIIYIYIYICVCVCVWKVRISNSKVWF